MTVNLPTDEEVADALKAWLPQQRWFSAKNREISAVQVVLRVPLAADDGFAAEHLLVAVEFSTGPTLRYQIPLGYRTHLSEPLLSWVLPDQAPDKAAAYDGLYDPDLTNRYRTALAAGESIGPLHFAALPGGDIPRDAPGRVMSAEQSNTSVVFGESLLFKVFRQLDVGINPDVELHRVLSEVGCQHVAELRGWIETELDGQPTTLAMAQDFIDNAADGWSMALISVRDLFAEADLHASEVGSDFAGEAERLGAAVANVHADLARGLGTAERAVGGSAITQMRVRLDAAAQAIPELEEFADPVRAVFEAAADAGPTPVQRIHGDLHLGQVLRTPSTWLLIDFEGEPLKSVSQRREPDSPLRDVAGMLRSFDYAGHHLLGERAQGRTGQREFRAAEWAQRNSAAFCDGYAAVAGSDPRAQSALLRAYELDKAVYEAVYEARHRPSWLPLPLQAIERLVS